MTGAGQQWRILFLPISLLFLLLFSLTISSALQLIMVTMGWGHQSMGHHTGHLIFLQPKVLDRMNAPELSALFTLRGVSSVPSAQLDVSARLRS